MLCRQEEHNLVSVMLTFNHDNTKIFYTIPAMCVPRLSLRPYPPVGLRYSPPNYTHTRRANRSGQSTSGTE